LLQEMAVLQAVRAPTMATILMLPSPRLAALLPVDETQLLYSTSHGREELLLAPDEYSGLVMILLRLLAFAPADGPKACRGQDRRAPRRRTCRGVRRRRHGRGPSGAKKAPRRCCPPPPRRRSRRWRRRHRRVDRAETRRDAAAAERWSRWCAARSRRKHAAMVRELATG
jgi:hypothetical protein